MEHYLRRVKGLWESMNVWNLPGGLSCKEAKTEDEVWATEGIRAKAGAAVYTVSKVGLVL